MEKDYYAMLDYLLKWISENSNTDDTAILERENHFKENDIGVYERTELFQKLENEGFIRRDFQEFERLTINGYLFIQDGGYKKKRSREATSKDLQSAQTWAIAIGTALAGLYSLFQLMIYFCGK